VTEVEGLISQTEQRSASIALTLKDTLRDAIEEAVGRFSSATDEIRNSATNIRQELNATREELKRGAFDLPEETRESAAAMRNAVAQQIDALQELSTLVSKTTRRSDASVETAAPRKSAPVAKAPTDSARLQSVREPVELPELEQSEHVSNFTSPTSTISTPPTEPTIGDKRQGNNSGWVRDLIRGADTQETSQDQASPINQNQRKPQHVVESLNSLSVDIARAIDHDASVELWQRYQRGERDIFTRRLYTIKGQKTFDDIQAKYAREPEFKKAVDRYMADFEKLLSDVSKNDPSNVIGQSYLTSDTGKVYTMLAHASGRLK
jgi:archaellum component FlaC